MYVVIVGAGKIGTSLAKSLISEGHEITVVDMQSLKCVLLDQILGQVSVEGNATDPRVLDKAGVSRADILIATTNKDDINLATCQLAKHHFGIDKAISTVNNPDRKELFSLLGVDVIIDVTSLIMDHIQQKALSSNEVVHLIPIPNNVNKSVVAINVPQNFSFGDRPTKTFPLPDDTILALVINNQGVVSGPDETTRIQPGDCLIAVASKDSEDTIRDFFYQAKKGM